MTSDLEFTCACCGAHHPELSMNYTAEAPAVWDPAFADADDCSLSTDQCVVRAQHYFVKGMIEIPVIGSAEVFSWGGLGLAQPRELLPGLRPVGQARPRGRKALLRLAYHRTSGVSDDET